MQPTEHSPQELWGREEQREKRGEREREKKTAEASLTFLAFGSSG